MAKITDNSVSRSLFGEDDENDTIDGGGGNDFIDGKSGIDTAVFFGNSSDFTVTDLSGVVHVTGLDGAPESYRGDTAELVNVEKVQFINLTTTLDSHTNNLIVDNSVSRSLFGEDDENDTIDGGGGNDFIDGKSGIDTAVFFGDSSDFTVIDLSGVVHVTGLDSAPESYRGDTAELVNVEKLQFLDKVFSRDVPSGTADDNTTNPAPKPDNTIAPTNAETETIDTNPNGIQTSASSKYVRWKFETLLPSHIEGSTWDLDAVDSNNNVFDGELVFETALLAESDINVEGYFDLSANEVTPFRIDFDAKLGMDGTFYFISTNLSPPVEGIAAAPQFEGKFSRDYQSLTGKWFETEAISGTWSATFTETNALSPEPNLDGTIAPADSITGTKDANLNEIQLNASSNLPVTNDDNSINPELEIINDNIMVAAANLGEIFADDEKNEININLIGLHENGIAFDPLHYHPVG